jgi:zinc transport system substrate-binding protein
VRKYLYLLIALIFISCSGKDPVKPDKMRIAVSIFPICNIVKNIAGDKAEVFFIVPAGANPHTFESSPSDVKKISNAGYFIGVDKNFDGWIEKYLSKESGKFYLIREDAFRMYEFNKNTGHDEKGHSGNKKNMHDDEGGINPHIWLTFRGGKLIAESVSKYLSEIDKPNAEYYKKNLRLYSEKLDSADKAAEGKFKKLKFKKFIQWHPSWNYFAADYGLEITGAIESGHSSEASVKTMKELAVNAKKNNVKIIIIDLELKNRAADALASEIDGRLVRLDSIGSPSKSGRSDYIELMNYNAEIIYNELGR